MEARKLLKSEPASFQLSLRIRHPSVDPAVLSREFKIDPEDAFGVAHRARRAAASLRRLFIRKATGSRL